jgi:hypothetical protein
MIAIRETYPGCHQRWDDPAVSADRAVRWMEAPEAHDFPAAASYLSLIAGDADIAQLVAAWKVATTTHFKAKDILRAARLDLLPVDNPHVASDLRKIRHDVALSPVLLVRGSLANGLDLQIADGYHRVCASYHTDENTDIPCLLVDAPARR